MAHYIDAEKLKERIEKLDMESCISEELSGFYYGIERVLELIDSLLNEQPECSSNLVDIDAVREDFITEVYRVLDADPTNDRANAIINAFDSLPTVSREQPEVDLAEEITRFFSKNPIPHEHITDWPLLKNTAIHFYGLRNRALEEASRHVYESWMGGTMDHVRRDMVELGKVLNARKEENK